MIVMEEESEGCGVKRCRSTLRSGSTSRPDVQDVIRRDSIILLEMRVRRPGMSRIAYVTTYVEVGLF